WTRLHDIQRRTRRTRRDLLIKRLCEFCDFCVDRCEELAGGPHRTLGLPERRAAVVAERVQRADVGERDDFVAAEASPRDEIVERNEAAGARGPVVRTDAAEPTPVVDALEHRLVVTAAFGAGRADLGFRLQASGFRLLPERGVRSLEPNAASRTDLHTCRGDRLSCLLPQTVHIPE